MGGTAFFAFYDVSQEIGEGEGIHTVQGSAKEWAPRLRDSRVLASFGRVGGFHAT